MASGSEAGEGDSPLSIIKPRAPEGLNARKGVIKYSVYYALVIEALMEAGLDDVLLFQGIMWSAYVLQCITH